MCLFWACVLILSYCIYFGFVYLLYLFWACVLIYLIIGNCIKLWKISIVADPMRLTQLESL